MNEDRAIAGMAFVGALIWLGVAGARGAKGDARNAWDAAALALLFAWVGLLWLGKVSRPTAPRKEPVPVHGRLYDQERAWWCMYPGCGRTDWHQHEREPGL